MAKKKKLDNSDPSINLRLPKELKDQLNEKAFRNSQTVSGYVRNLLSDYLTGELYKKEIEFYKNTSFITSIEFIQLIVWMYEKKKSHKCEKEDEKVLSNHISTLKKVEGNVPDELSKEFDGVLTDLLNVKKDTDIVKFFRFCNYETYSPGFSYEKLENYLRDLKIED